MKKSYVLILMQFTLITVIVLYCGVRGETWQNIITLVAVGLGLWAVAVMKFHVSVFPNVRKSQQLYTGGPYRLIRHPMYTAVLSSTGAWIYNRLDVISVAVWLLLLANLIVKLKYEEGLLNAKFPAYTEYMQRSKRLLPFIY